MGEYLLEIQDLKTYFKVRAGKVRAVDGVSFAIKPGEKLGVVGESGCGKSVTALSIMRLLPQPPGEIAGGSVLFEDQEFTGFTRECYAQDTRWQDWHDLSGPHDMP